MFRSSQLAIIFLLAAWPLLSNAQNETDSERGFTRFAEHTVYHSVFSSTAVKPKIAALHGITRAGNQVLVNVALVANSRQVGGEPARVSGSATNLMQQRRELKFTAIDEGDVVYYLAPLRVTEQELLHFTLTVESESGDPAYDVKFSKTVYVNN